MKKKKSGGKKRKNDNLKIVYLFVLAFSLLGVVIYSLYHSREPVGVSTDKQQTPRYAAPEFKEKEVFERRPVIRTGRPRLAIIIDDIGFNKSYQDLIDIGVPLTLAVIPFTPYADRAASSAYRAGLEIMLHLPMEPHSSQNAPLEKYTLRVKMNRHVMIDNLTKNIEALDHIKGVNNHMGSRFTESESGMKIVLQELKRRGLYYVDSKTTLKSRGFELAKALNLKTAQRAVFLDNVLTEKAITAQLLKAIRIAKQSRDAVAICHPHKETIQTLAKLASRIEKSGVELVVASKLVR